MFLYFFNLSHSWTWCVNEAYVCGEKKGIILEKPLYMGETLNGGSPLDIEEEKMLVGETLHKLRANKATPQLTRTTMRKLGIQRFLILEFKKKKIS